MPVRKIAGLLLVGAIMLSFGTSWGATPGVSASAQKTITAVGGDKLEVAGQFAFDPIVKSGKFIIGEMSCIAVALNAKTVTISKCYIVLSTGATYVGPVKSGSSLVVSDKTLTNVPAVNITQCITVSALFKDGTTAHVHLSSAPKGELVLPCKLG